MREAEGYRPQLELLTDMFPGRAAITVNECQTALGIDRRQVRGAVDRAGALADAEIIIEEGI